MIDIFNIVLTNSEIEKCREFSEISASSQQAVEFGQHTTKARSKREIARDNLIGKIAEAAFSKLMKENYNLDVPLDFNYYPRGQWDNQDAEINGWRIDIKATRSGGRWMLIEWNKLNFRQKDNNLSHLFVMFTVDWDRNIDQPTGKVIYRGVVSLAKLKEGVPTTMILRKGDVLPGTRTHLQADNYGIPFQYLYKNLDVLVKNLLASPPPQSLTDRYRNPYTGRTTIEMTNKYSNISKEVIHNEPVKNQNENNEEYMSKSSINETFTEKENIFKKIRHWIKSLFN